MASSFASAASIEQQEEEEEEEEERSSHQGNNDNRDDEDRPPPAKRSKQQQQIQSTAVAAAAYSVNDALDRLSGKVKFPEKNTSFDDNNNEEADRLSQFPEEVVYRITSFLDPTDLLLRLGAVNRHYHDVCHRNAAGWEQHCENLFRSKLHVSLAAIQVANNDNTSPSSITNKCAAYRLALADSSRQYVTLDEFCYDGNNNNNNTNGGGGGGTVWSFRFKESAGADWTSNDPWYQGSPCRKFVFLRDGTVQTVVSSNNNNTLVLADPPLRMTWRFLTRPMDLPSRPMGSYVRFSVGGRDVPTYAVRRSPTGNWGFVLESCWGVYASFELPPKRNHAAALLRRRPSEIGGGVVWLHSNAADMQDDSLTLTNEIQWREAFLYNVGARVLPEGEEATNEFDRAWQNL